MPLSCSQLLSQMSIHFVQEMCIWLVCWWGGSSHGSIPQTPLLLFCLYKALLEHSVRLEKFCHLPKFLICCSLLVLTFSPWQLFQNLFSSTLLHKNGRSKPPLYIFVFISSFDKEYVFSKAMQLLMWVHSHQCKRLEEWSLLSKLCFTLL